MYESKKKNRGEFYKPLQKPTFLSSRVPEGFCKRMMGIVLRCNYDYQCWKCEYADRAQTNFANDPPPYPTIDVRSVLPERSGKQLNYLNKVVAVTDDCLTRLGRRPLLYYQFFKCVDGYGCLPDNTVWEVDGYFLSEPDKPVTLQRLDILGIPTLNVCKNYDRYFFANTVRDCGYCKGG